MQLSSVPEPHVQTDHPEIHPEFIQIRPWPDAVLDTLGHDPRSNYVERFWLGILGPSSIWLLRHMAAHFERHPAGFELDVALCAASLGLGRGTGRNAPLTRTVTRLCQFGVAQRHGTEHLAVRRQLPSLVRHQLARLPVTLAEEHESWLAHPSSAAPSPMATLAVIDEPCRLALGFIDAGDAPREVERRLRQLGHTPPVARNAAQWAWSERRRRHPTANSAA